MYYSDWLDEASGHIPQALQQAEVFTLYEEISTWMGLVNGDVTFESTDPRIDPLALSSLCSKLPEEAECSICLGKLHDALSDSDARLLRLSACHHVFHHVCLDELINGVEANSNRCPLCRKELCKPRDKEPVLFP
jgi:hypothetical protein